MRYQTTPGWAGDSQKNPLVNQKCRPLSNTSLARQRIGERLRVGKRHYRRATNNTDQ
jgi:hypothetical protein